MKPTATTTGAEAALFAAGRHVDDIELLSLENLLRRRPAHQDKARAFVARVDAGAATEIGALRWMMLGGVAPLTVAPADFAQCVEVASRAALHARMAHATTVILLEHEIAELEGMPVEPDMVKSGPLAPMPPLDPLLPQVERELRSAMHKLNQAPRMSRLDADSTPGAKPEWLVISYGTSVAPAAQAVTEARVRGQRVNHLELHTLWPVPEEAIQKAAVGVKHVVVPERNLGQYIDDIRRILPMQTVIPANTVPGPVPAALILDRLLNTPRCC